MRRAAKKERQLVHYPKGGSVLADSRVELQAAYQRGAPNVIIQRGPLTISPRPLGTSIVSMVENDEYHRAGTTGNVDRKQAGGVRSRWSDHTSKMPHPS